jgi:hypothetical protein
MQDIDAADSADLLKASRAAQLGAAASDLDNRMGTVPASAQLAAAAEAADNRMGSIPPQGSVSTTRAPSRPASSSATTSSPAATSSASPSNNLSNLLSSIFTNRPVSTRDLFEQSSRNPEDAGAWMRAERQYAKTHPNDPSFDVTKLDKETGMKRGGTAGGMHSKDAALHKALDIIHSMMMRGRH